jgi:hypothetical protein
MLVCSWTWSPAAADEFQDTIAPFLAKHCAACHGTEKQEARIRLDQVAGFQAGDRNLWTLVHDKLASGEMPPEDHPQPSAAEKKALLTWIEKEQRALGAGSLRRLNRRELAAALQDVTGLAVAYSDALPGDGTVDGFDTGADGLHDAADSVAQVMRVTRRAVESLRFLEPAGPVHALDLREIKDIRKTFDAWKEFGIVTKSRGVPRPSGIWIEPLWVGDRGSFDINVPTPADGSGVLRFKIAVAAVRPLAGVPNPHLWVEVGAKDIDYREITATTDRPQELIYEVQIDDLAIQNQSVRISLSNRVEIPYAVEGFENEDKSKPEDMLPVGASLFRPLFDRKQLTPEQQPVPFLVLQHIEIEPNYVAAWPPTAWETVPSTTITDDSASAGRLLALWMERAWRRPVSAADQERFMELYASLRKQDMSFDEALQAAFQAVLLSSSFRYLPSPADPDPVIEQHAIASRLSFMLSGAPPDAELRRLAAAGKLRDPKVLSAQVDRLLDDPRSEAFVRPFVMQWLVLEQPITIVMDHIQRQDFRFGRYLKASMREETIAYVAQLLAENRPAKELIESDWTMMNNSLAVHYGYEGIVGGEFRKVKLRNDDPRGGGILAHAGIQSMLCWMGENWVIYRGAWALRHILDDPPPPPPLEVPELIPSDGAHRGKTYRELLQQHQEDAKCSICHKNMDPLGFAFQNFDLSGRWRDVEHERYERSELDGKIAWRGVGKTRPVDALGHLPRGEAFQTFAECKALIAQHYVDDLVGGMLKNLLLYATGRQADVAVAAEIKTIQKNLASRKYPLRDVVKAVVMSQAFLDN